ncbi:glycosyltransferase family 2 protein [Candidatus Pelagibacter sp.]|jgi:dolichol-phosphate mannosyltransferase|nr:glycosyltransferase family 2 protein [Candidatus Pelagibacter sp.]
MSLSIIIPVYNESSQIPITIKKLSVLKNELNDFEIVFIDNLSSDDTLKKLKFYTKKKSYFKIYKSKKRGLGSAISTGIIKSKKKYICIFMSDMSDDIKDLVKYFKIISKNKLDAVFGSRFLSQSKVKNYPTHKLILNRFINNIIKLIFLSDYNDFTNAFKIYRRSTLNKLFPLVSENFNIFLEIPLKIITRNFTYKIIPINWTGRKKGTSKFRIKELGSMYLFTLLYCLFEKILLRKNEI